MTQEACGGLLQPRKRYTRGEIVARLKARTEKKKALLLGGAGIGLTAKMQDTAGLDLIMVSSEAVFRMMGQPSALSYLACGNANSLMLDAARRVVRMALHTPVIGGLAPGDPDRELEQLLEETAAAGLDGITNQPAGEGFGPALDGDVEGSLLHSSAEQAMVEACRRRGLFCVMTVFSAGTARRMAALGADALIVHMGFTVGGLAGAPAREARNLEWLCGEAEKITGMARAQNPDVFVFLHGGMLNTPQAVQQCLLHSGADGFYGGSVFDRLPMEQAITGVVQQLKSLPLKSKKEG